MRPIRDAAEQASWDCLMEAHHYLGFRSPFGAALRHVEELSGGEWAVLFGSSHGAVQGRGAGALARLAAGAAVPAAAPDCQRRTVSGFAGLPSSESGVAGSGPVSEVPVFGPGGAAALGGVALGAGRGAGLGRQGSLGADGAEPEAGADRGGGPWRSPWSHWASPCSPRTARPSRDTP